MKEEWRTSEKGKGSEWRTKTAEVCKRAHETEPRPMEGAGRLSPSGRHETTLTVVSGETDRAGRRSVFKGKVEAREFAMMVQRPRLLHEIVITEYCLSL